MRWFANRSVAQRIAATLGLLLLIILGYSILSFRLSTQSAQTVEVTTRSLEEVEEAASLESAWTDLITTLDYMLLTRQPILVEREVEGELVTFGEALNQLQALGEEGMGISNLDDLSRLSADLVALVEEVSSLAEEERWARVQALRYTELSSLDGRFRRQLGELAENSAQAAERAVVEARQLERSAQLTTRIAAVVAVVLAAVTGYFLTRSLVRPISALTEGAEHFAQGNFGTRVHITSKDELGQLATAFNTMAADLQDYYGALEQRVAERTRALETSVEVGRRLASILDVSELVSAVVSQVRDAFDYYHVHIYLVDETHERLLMRGGTGEAGRVMLARGHSLEWGQGLVGRAARQNQPVLVADTEKSSDWLPNPLLPETAAEVAVPISYAGTVLGVLDVQHNLRDGLDQDDLALLESISSQIAVALQNARLLQQAQQRAEQAATVNVVAQKIQRANSVDEVLKLAASELGQILNLDSARVQLRSSVRTVLGNGDVTAVERDED